MTERTTPFIEHHRNAGAKIIPFAGYLMPIQYEGIRAEHEAVRNAVGLFDVSHMGEFQITGPGAVSFVDRLVTNHVAGAEPGQAIYSPMCTPDGGIIDDLLVYRYADRILLVVNAANIAADWEHVTALAPPDVKVENHSFEIAQLAVQGPRACELLKGVVPDDVFDLAYYRFTDLTVWDAKTVVSRTGYTGEDGFELYFQAEYADRFWERLRRKGEALGLKPCGLGARDLLRLEMGYCLYGNDIDRTTNPLEAGLGWTVKLDKDEFVGKEALLEAKESGLRRRLAGFEVDGKRIARHGMDVEHSGETVGTVTSGTFSPSLTRGIGMAYVPTALSKLGSEFDVDAGRTKIGARVVRRPFYDGAFHSRKPVNKISEAKQ
jgi:aminomethyltransferase